jgi:hypothetical protein
MKSSPGLPDAILSNQKSHFWYILEGLGMDNVGILFGRLEYMISIWCILWQFCAFCGYFVYFSRFGMFYQEKSGNPAAPVSQH